MAQIQQVKSDERQTAAVLEIVRHWKQRELLIGDKHRQPYPTDPQSGFEYAVGPFSGRTEYGKKGNDQKADVNPTPPRGS